LPTTTGTAPGIAALFIDLDGFKGVNDSLGHHVGDRLLQCVAGRLTGAVREADTIGRLGGDEFVVLLDDTLGRGAPALVAERILHVLRQPFELDDVDIPLRITASVGIAIAPSDTASELLSSADVALYAAKAAGKDCYETFRPGMQTAARRRYELELDLRGALDAGEYRLMYQPIYGLADLTPIGFEALLRWEHPVHGMLPPNEFIPLLESSGQIVEVGRWVLHEACRQVAAWRRTAPQLTMSVNVSARQLDRETIIDDVRDALMLADLEPAALTIEITETALMTNVEATARRLQALKRLGVSIAIDDFGTGYSSLAYLQQFPVDYLKIDRAFTSAIASSPEGDALIHTLVQLGKILGLKTLAEGVETGKQVTHLRGEQMDAVQGFLLSRPLTAASVERNLMPTVREAAYRRPMRIAD
jgi:diguanylate cyclase (GGDEF)-like protein